MLTGFLNKRTKAHWNVAGSLGQQLLFLVDNQAVCSLIWSDSQWTDRNTDTEQKLFSNKCVFLQVVCCDVSWWKDLADQQPILTHYAWPHFEKRKTISPREGRQFISEHGSTVYLWEQRSINCKKTSLKNKPNHIQEFLLFTRSPFLRVSLTGAE